MKYNYYDIKNAYEKIGVSKGMTVALKTDLRFLGPYEKGKGILKKYNIEI